MTLKELLEHLDQNLDYTYVVKGGDTLQTAKEGNHPDTLIGELITAISEKCQCNEENCSLERVDVVNAMGPIRLKYMADDAPVAGFQLIERTIVGIDDAFNAEAIRNKT